MPRANLLEMRFCNALQLSSTTPLHEYSLSPTHILRNLSARPTRLLPLTGRMTGYAEVIPVNRTAPLLPVCRPLVQDRLNHCRTVSPLANGVTEEHMRTRLAVILLYILAVPSVEAEATKGGFF